MEALILGAFVALLHTIAAMAIMDLSGRIHATECVNGPNTPYDEDILVGLITDIYKLFLKIRPAEAYSISWSPPEGRELNVSSLPAEAPVAFILPEMASLDYSYTPELLQSRLANVRNYDEYLQTDESIFAPLQLSCFSEEAMTLHLFWCLTSKTVYTIRWVGDVYQLKDEYTHTENNQKKLDDYRYEPTNWPAMSASRYFETVLHNYREAIWIPNSVEGIDVADRVSSR
ncbi:hypothetical protein M409DRAFT_56617 [Zasmidium cellare ATCC 36951]|uniref:Uncharacterized protein n=1 Tax=Zasmidium cellare ATCC 36951 TaxID=1080233 RepID=A0A6A6CBC8_ZASCE|nr:uncharacterized protein M409DRAFT_56617 [Zasmidium cellare ATCC 36951]KAF2164341.1 hypothetical protein M409DRAFT_56617 [Zasmidium cellare ATCC 36951]